MTAAEHELRQAVELAVAEGMGFVQIAGIVMAEFEKQTPGQKG